MTKVCTKCKIEKPTTDYHKDITTTIGTTSHCKTCKREYKKTYNKDNKHLTRAYKLKIRYNITIQEYKSMLSSQDGKCHICGIHHTELPIALCIDHCHSTGQVRGLLCGKCNQGLGLFKDDIEALERAIQYLKDSND